jgi:hypothetical protein
MIHSGPFRCKNDSFREMFWNVLSLMLRAWMAEKCLWPILNGPRTPVMIRFTKSCRWDCHRRLHPKCPMSTGKHRHYKPVQNQYSEYYSTGKCKTPVEGSRAEIPEPPGGATQTTKILYYTTFCFSSQVSSVFWTAGCWTTGRQTQNTILERRLWRFRMSKANHTMQGWHTRN